MTSSVNPPIGPYINNSKELCAYRQHDFFRTCETAICETITAINFPVCEDENLSHSDFFDKHVTVKGMEELNGLDGKTNVLFKTILGKALYSLDQMFPIFRENLRLKAIQAGNERWASEYLQQKALPIVQSAITDIEKKWPGIVKEATLQGIPPSAKAMIDLFKI
jgi:hypothetical protein